jgi:hypothetical protein
MSAAPPVSRWVGPPGSRPGTFREWQSRHPSPPFRKELQSVRPGTDQRWVAVVTEQGLAQVLAPELSRFTADLQLAGYSILTYEVSGGTPQSLRGLLQDAYASYNIEGAMLIGNLPVAWFQIKRDIGNNYDYAEWPIDLYYMDLNGNWFDTLRYDPIDTLVPGSDSIFDAHSGTVLPEIYVGRLVPNGMGDSVALLRNYFRKNHAFRVDSLPFADRALVFGDDDWTSWAEEWSGNVRLAFPTARLFWDPETTTAARYRVELDTPQTWVSVFAHAWSQGYGFYYDQHSQMDYYYAREYFSQDPPALFYNHFACSFGRYTDTGYGGGRSIFDSSYGLGAIASTKIGSMLYFDHFYDQLGLGHNLGAAYRAWWRWLGANGYYSYETVCWHYGMTLLGDPFLSPVIYRDVALLSIVAPGVGAESGLAVVPRVRATNRGSVPADFHLRLSIGSDYLDSTAVTGLSPGETTIVALPVWLPERLGHAALLAQVAEPDLNPRNDTLRRDVLVYVPDIAALGVQSPTGTVDTLPLTPKVLFRNLSLAPQTFYAVMEIRDTLDQLVYLDSAQIIDAPPGSQTLGELPDWQVPQHDAEYQVMCRAQCPADPHHENDTTRALCHVAPGSSLFGDWTRRAPVPEFGVYAGGSLAITQSGRVFLFNGGYTCAFREYDPVLDRWTSRESIPMVGRNGDSVPVGAGGSLTAVGDRLYATKGGSPEFWEYVPDTSAYPWVERASLPDSALLGARLCAAEPYVYFVQGAGRFGFWRYDPSEDAWTSCARPDSLGLSPFGHGWGLTWDGEDIIYALHSDSNELIAYSIAGDSWYRLVPLPFLNQRSDSTSARYAVITHRGGRLYALKGHDTGEFWTYDLWYGLWTELDSLPGRTRHQADFGAGLTYSALGRAIYAVKGNGLTEFWMAPLVPPSAVTEPKEAAVLPLKRLGLSLYPNPLSSGATIACHAPAPGRVSLKVCDITGRTRATLASGHMRAGDFSCRWSGRADNGELLANGVYFLRFTVAGRTETRTISIVR